MTSGDEGDADKTGGGKLTEGSKVTEGGKERPDGGKVMGKKKQATRQSVRLREKTTAAATATPRAAATGSTETVVKVAFGFDSFFSESGEV